MLAGLAPQAHVRKQWSCRPDFLTSFHLHCCRFQALLNGNPSMASRLLAGSGADQLALVAPASNFTVLHAAVLSKCDALLPQLAALCTTAGVPVDAALQLGRGSMNRLKAAIKQLLLGLGMQRPQHVPELRDGATPLSLAVK